MRMMKTPPRPTLPELLRQIARTLIKRPWYSGIWILVRASFANTRPRYPL